MVQYEGFENSMGIKDLVLILYTHTDYKDIWPIYFGQNKKYIDNKQKKYIFTNKYEDTIPDDYEVILYNDADTYRNRVISCLKNIKGEYCIFSHEDMFLYDKPNYDLIKQYLSIMSSDNLDFIKILKTSNCTDLRYNNYNTLYNIDINSNRAFGIQPFIWKTKSLLNVFSENSGDTIWQLEANIRNKTCKELNIKGVYHYNNENKRGLYHWDSNLWPYVATAIVKGKWNYSEYSKEISQLCYEYKVNMNGRGFF